MDEKKKKLFYVAVWVVVGGMAVAVGVTGVAVGTAVSCARVVTVGTPALSGDRWSRDEVAVAAGRQAARLHALTINTSHNKPDWNLCFAI